MKVKLTLSLIVLSIFTALIYTQFSQSQAVAATKNVQYWTLAGAIIRLSSPPVVGNYEEITATNKNTNITYITLPNSRGQYIFPSLEEGTYVVQPKSDSWIYSPTFRTVELVEPLLNVVFSAKPR